MNKKKSQTSVLGMLASIVMVLSIAISPILTSNANAQQMDAQLNMAKRSVDQIEQRLKQLKTGDVAQYNKLSEQLTKAADQLKSTTSQAHPDFQVTVQKWSALRTEMMTLAQTWQNQQNTASQNNAANPQTASSSGEQNSGSATSSGKVNADAILAKYQRENRPKLSNYPNPSEVGEWAAKMKALQSTELQADLNRLNDASVSASDRSRVSRWISGEFQNQINQDIKNAMQKFNSLATTAVQVGQQVQGIDASDKMRAYNFASGENGRRNTQTLDAGLVASANAMALDEAFPNIANPKRQQEIGVIAMAQQKLQDLSEVAQEQGKVLAKLPKKKKKKREVFLKGIDQELFYRGSTLAYINKKGSIWMNSEDVGDIMTNGEIYIYSNSLGSLEPDGKLWHRGNHIGTIEDNGKVWRNSTHVGTVVDGKVWIDGNQNGRIEPYDGEWKRAAVIFYFRDYFTRDR